MQNLSIKPDKKISEFTALEFWNLSIERYRISKRIRRIIPRNKDKGFDYNKFSKVTGFNRHYIYQVTAMNIYPCQEFIKKLEDLEKKGNIQ